MRGLDIIEQIRRNLMVTAGTLPDYTDAVLYDEMNTALHTTFEDVVASARSGYWCKPVFLTTANGRPKYRIPARAVVGGLEKVEIAMSSTADYVPLPACTEEQAADYERNAANLGSPQAYVVRGDQIVILPTPNASLPLRLWYYIRPSRLVAPQSGALVTSRGRITSINTSTRVIIVDVLPLDQETVGNPPLSGNITPCDIVHKDGWHELSMVNITISNYAGTTLTVAGTESMDEVELGDYLRFAEQTDWPCLPDDFHRMLADVTSAAVLVQLGLSDKAAQITELVGPAAVRFKDLITPRVKADPPTIGLGGGWGGGSRWVL